MQVSCFTTVRYLHLCIDLGRVVLELHVSRGQLEDRLVDVSLEQAEDDLVRDAVVVDQVLAVLCGHEGAADH